MGRGKITHLTHGFWFEKFQGQIRIIHTKRKTEALERFYSSEIALAHLFLYLFLEATLDEVAKGLCDFKLGMHGRTIYKNKARSLWQKLDFLFSEFCEDLPLKDFFGIKKKIQIIVDLRNGVIHLEEISWQIDDALKSQSLPEVPNKFSKYLTMANLDENYRLVISFLEDLRALLGKGFAGQEIDFQDYVEDKKHIHKERIVDRIFSLTVPSFSKFLFPLFTLR